jgi:pimeloyl-ACP methyl ester carboxylesterase
MLQALATYLMSVSTFLHPVEQDNLQKMDPDSKLDFTELCTTKGYIVEPHWVTTDDGYILQVFHVGGKNTGGFNEGPPVFMQHGLLDSSDTFIVNNEDIAPGFILLNKGYDVWFGNNRGNVHSRNHTTLNPDKNEFWQFSWDHMVLHDIDA